MSGTFRCTGVFLLRLASRDSMNAKFRQTQQADRLQVLRPDLEPEPGDGSLRYMFGKLACLRAPELAGQSPSTCSSCMQYGPSHA